MNATGLAVALAGVSTALKTTPLFEGLVTSGQIKQDEVDGAAEMAQALATNVGGAWTESLEGIVGEYNDQLIQHSNSFHEMKETDPLGALREAQLMMGYVSTILVKAKVRRN